MIGRSVQRKLARIAALAATILTTGVVSAGESDVLYWMIDGNASITTDAGSGSTATIKSFFENIGTYFPDISTGEGSAFAARVRVTGGDITEDTFLNLYIPGYGVDSGEVEFSDVGGHWGAGVPTGNQSPLGDYGSPEYSFMIELGNIDSSDNWTTVATGAATSYSSLGDYIHATFDINPGQTAAWTPGQFTAVPEPSGGLLMLMGIALLALRRKRVGEVA